MRALAMMGALALGACSAAQGQAEQGLAEPGAEAHAEGLERAVFAGGCFWCMEADFQRLDGVVEATSGYTGGHLPNPSYHQVITGLTGHYEAVEVVFDPDEVGYETLLEHYWRNIDPVDVSGQFCDGGAQYRTAIFVEGEDQRAAAEASLEDVASSGRFPSVATQVLDLGPFYTAEAYHQDYFLEHAQAYSRYRAGCRRDRRLEELWGEEAGGLVDHDET